ncbi:MAG TPA: FMN-binding negative transcriptional regulator [Acetobacteraceae bacterium]|nr:FMN-binding negative transcriptional regulator [Acetobacteraceae bacterium]
MYTPPAFAEKNQERLHALIEAAPFATLVTLTGAGLIASHVPLLLDRSAGEHGTLIGHLARPNPQASTTRSEVEALAIFLGPQFYVTPSWYPTKRETGKVVPTWNYVAIHVYGRLQFFDEPERLLAIVTRLTNRHEGAREKPWAVSDAPADFVAGMLRGIVGFEIAITRIEGKAKMSQNRPAADRVGVIAGLRDEGHAELAETLATYTQP